MDAHLIRIVLITSPNSVARSIARTLVEERLAACVNIVPEIVSVYRWEDSIHEDSEALLVVKTHSTLLDRLAERVVSIHPYTLPEVIVLPIETGLPDYLKWVAQEVKGA